MFCYLWFGVFGVFAFVNFRVNGCFPTLLYRVIECFGLVCILDPIFTLADNGIKYYTESDTQSDMFRLWYYFDEREASGGIGIAM
mmetsp:Transcript_29804/g.5379  ORF Transcript_29804/g.5379 Transcript_29804/m.5379 type:complete len:85 (+) Transcript_29804:1520-1774(+)